jgi:hypothetical protein
VRTLLLATLLLVGCAPVGPEGEAFSPSPAAAPLPPAGLGTLREEEISVTLRDGQLQLRITPLSEEVIRLAAPDTHARLAALAAHHRERHREAEGTFFLLTFMSAAEGEAFDPGAVAVDTRGGQATPRESTGLTPGWGERRLRARVPEMGVVSLRPEVELGLPFTVRYGGVQSQGWGAVIARLDAERARIGSGG